MPQVGVNQRQPIPLASPMHRPHLLEDQRFALAPAECTSNSALVGFEKALNGLAHDVSGQALVRPQPACPNPAHALHARCCRHRLVGLQVSGTFRILDDCTAEVAGFTYDGLGPAVWWWGAPSTDNQAIRDSGRRIDSTELITAYNGETVGCCLFACLLRFLSRRCWPGGVRQVCSDEWCRCGTVIWQWRARGREGAAALGILHSGCSSGLLV
jgi:hypothetical protein